MTGPEHYREAERLLEDANVYSRRDDAEPAAWAALISEAQVHATLALAAATALNRPDGEGMVRDDYREWMRTASAKPPKDSGKSSV